MACSSSGSIPHSTFHGDLEAYIKGKEAFVQEVERRALEWRANPP